MSQHSADSLSPTDWRYLQAASRLSRRHQGLTGSNPSVGCIIVTDFGYGPVVVGTGVTDLEGRPHAERVALAEAGELAKNATVYVTLEPCSHQGKTTPCVDALVEAGVERVVSGIVDPDDRVNGQGHANLQAAGVSVGLASQDHDMQRPLAGYLFSKQHDRPFVTLKLAMTETGVMGHRDHGNARITGAEANRQTHLMRARHDAILVGMGTVRADNPMLNCRLPGLAERSPIRVVVSGSEFPQETYRIFETADEIPTLWTGKPTQATLPDGVDRLEIAGSGDAVDLQHCMRLLHSRQIQSVMVEGGSSIAASLLRDDLVDELVIHVGGAPQLDATGGEWVVAPVTPGALPAGFELCEERVFGQDRALRYRKV